VQTVSTIQSGAILNSCLGTGEKMTTIIRGFPTAERLFYTNSKELANTNGNINIAI
jgi:hypothetical protein